jgi:hypothetical protein
MATLSIGLHPAKRIRGMIAYAPIGGNGGIIGLRGIAPKAGVM